MVWFRSTHGKYYKAIPTPVHTDLAEDIAEAEKQHNAEDGQHAGDEYAKEGRERPFGMPSGTLHAPNSSTRQTTTAESQSAYFHGCLRHIAPDRAL